MKTSVFLVLIISCCTCAVRVRRSEPNENQPDESAEIKPIRPFYLDQDYVPPNRDIQHQPAEEELWPQNESNPSATSLEPRAELVAEELNVPDAVKIQDQPIEPREELLEKKLKPANVRIEPRVELVKPDHELVNAGIEPREEIAIKKPKDVKQQHAKIEPRDKLVAKRLKVEPRAPFKGMKPEPREDMIVEEPEDLLPVEHARPKAETEPVGKSADNMVASIFSRSAIDHMDEHTLRKTVRNGEQLEDNIATPIFSRSAIDDTDGRLFASIEQHAGSKAYGKPGVDTLSPFFYRSAVDSRRLLAPIQRQATIDKRIAPEFTRGAVNKMGGRMWATRMQDEKLKLITPPDIIIQPKSRDNKRSDWQEFIGSKVNSPSRRRRGLARLDVAPQPLKPNYDMSYDELRTMIEGKERTDELTHLMESRSYDDEITKMWEEGKTKDEVNMEPSRKKRSVVKKDGVEVIHVPKSMIRSAMGELSNDEIDVRSRIDSTEDVVFKRSGKANDIVEGTRMGSEARMKMLPTSVDEEMYINTDIYKRAARDSQTSAEIEDIDTLHSDLDFLRSSPDVGHYWALNPPETMDIVKDDNMDVPFYRYTPQIHGFWDKIFGNIPNRKTMG